MNNIKSIAHVFGCVDNYKCGHSTTFIWTFMNLHVGNFWMTRSHELFFLICHNDISWYITLLTIHVLTLIYHDISSWYITLIYHDISAWYIMIYHIDISAWYITSKYHDISHWYIMIYHAYISPSLCSDRSFSITVKKT